MGFRKSFIGQVIYRVGLIVNGKNEDSYEYQTDAWAAEARCGCGIDCCERELVLTDKITEAGFVSLFFEDGVMKFRLADGSVYAVTAVLEPPVS